MAIPRIYQDRSNHVVDYFTAYTDLADKQLEHLWLPNEIKVEKDKQSILIDMTEAERHGTLTTLKLFTMYEVFAGSEYWNTRFRNILRGPEFERMASVFGMFELAVHKPFYQKINNVLGLDTEEFYSEYVNDPVLKSRMDHVDSIVNDSNDLVSLGGFSFVEGVVLYSNFGFLKHFNAKGKNKANNIGRGINFSLSDENGHQFGSAMAFRQMVKELTEDNAWDPVRHGSLEYVTSRLRDCARLIYEHESAIIDKIFEEGPIEGITPEHLKVVDLSRINYCMESLGLGVYQALEPDRDYNPIADWFYDSINAYSMNDFFAGVGKEYHRAWDEDQFDFKTMDEFAGEEE